MIARNSVILIYQIETERARGLHPWDAVVEAATHRFRPILLTAAAAILGRRRYTFLFPVPGPTDGVHLIAVATILTLIFLPALYVTFFRIKATQPSADKPATLATHLSQPEFGGVR